MKKILYCFIVALALTIMSGCSSSSININDYTTIEITGHEQHGTATFSFDEEKFISDLIDKKIIENESIGYDVSKYFKDKGTLYCDNNGYLKNGDSVVYKWGIDDEDLKNYLKTNSIDCSISHEDISLVVNSLPESETIKLKDYVDYKLEGNTLMFSSIIDLSKAASMPNVAETGEYLDDLGTMSTITFNVGDKQLAIAFYGPSFGANDNGDSVSWLTCFYVIDGEPVLFNESEENDYLDEFGVILDTYFNTNYTKERKSDLVEIPDKFDVHYYEGHENAMCDYINSKKPGDCASGDSIIAYGGGYSNFCLWFYNSDNLIEFWYIFNYPYITNDGEFKVVTYNNRPEFQDNGAGDYENVDDVRDSLHYYGSDEDFIIKY